MSRSRVDNREYMREYRARKRDGEDAACERPVAPVAPVVQDQVQAELDSLPQAKLMLAAAATALALAAVLDDPDATPQKPAAAAQLRMTMAEIRAAKVPGGESKLTLIRGGRRAS